MAQIVKVWFDPEADFLEVTFSDAPGYMREIECKEKAPCQWEPFSYMWV
jgi:hypothetical protein